MYMIGLLHTRKQVHGQSPFYMCQCRGNNFHPSENASRRVDIKVRIVAHRVYLLATSIVPSFWIHLSASGTTDEGLGLASWLSVLSPESVQLPSHWELDYKPATW